MNFQKPKKIFLVDDDVMLTEAFTDYLTRNVAHNITAFHTGEECLKHLSESPDLIILDYYLNSIHKDAVNRMEILETIKKHYPEIYVIMLSSQESYNTAMQSIRKGAEQYVIKDEDAFEKIAQLIDEML
jgi:two-component system OmpR family response regulator